MGMNRFIQFTLLVSLLSRHQVMFVFGEENGNIGHSEDNNKANNVQKMEESKAEETYISYMKNKVDDSLFLHGFIASFSMIIVSEFGDKTFFIAAIMAMRHSRVVVFAGVLGSAVAMTILSAMLGYATTIIPRQVTYYASSILFLVFGIKMIKEGWYMSPDEAQEEYEEVQEELKKKEKERSTAIQTKTSVFIEAFVLTFIGEWGDRSQIATIILTAREDVVGVILGGCLGQALCTGVAVLAGRLIAQKISARSVTLVGGVVFILIAVTGLLLDAD